jgi:purine nucleosidase
MRILHAPLIVVVFSWLFLPRIAGASEKVPIIVDTDIGTDIDDAFALALALQSPELQLVGVTTVSADAYTRALIACRMLEAVGRADVPVAAGRPRRARPEQKGQYQYGLDPSFQKRPVAESAVEFIFAQLKAHPGELTLVSIGDLTNLGRLITEHPESKPLIKRIVIMGGAVRVGYNGKPPASWEWNIRSDIKAAQTVFSSGLPLVVAPLDATTMLKLQEPMRERIFSANTSLADQLHALYRLWGKTTPTLFDPVAVMLSFNETFCEMEDLRIEVDDQGFTREAPGKPNAHVATSIRRDDFLKWYVGRIAGSNTAVISPVHGRQPRRIPPSGGFATGQMLATLKESQ